MKIEAQIMNAAIGAVKALYGQEVPEKMVQLQKTRSEFEGNLTLVVFPFLKISKKSPELTAQEIGQYLTDHCEAVASYNVVKGFLNLVVAPQAWLSMLTDIDADEQYGHKQATEKSPLVMIEYSSPNTNKPLHLGHVRNNLLGWSLAQIMQANGNKVVKTNIVNDRGIHICKSMLAWLKWGNGETPETSGKRVTISSVTITWLSTNTIGRKSRNSWLRGWTRRRQNRRLRSSKRHMRCSSNGKTMTLRYVPCGRR